MVKVVWFLRRAPHLSLSEFRRWWLENHAVILAADQKALLRKYVVNVRVDEDSDFAGRPATDSPWDGLAEQWFDSLDDYNAVYAKSERPTRADTLANTSALERLVVEEFAISIPR